MMQTVAGEQREVADLLLFHKDELIVFQVKTRRLPGRLASASKHELGRITARISRAVRQVKTIKRAIDNNGLAEVENLRGIKLPFDGAAKLLTGIVVFDVFDARGLTEGENLSIAGGLDRVREIPVHIFSASDFEIIVRELDTIPDLLMYLRVREQLMQRQILVPSTRELDLLGVFLTRYSAIRDCMDGELHGLAIEEGYWEEIHSHHADAFARRDERRRPSQVVDVLISRLHTLIGYEFAVEIEATEGASLPEDVSRLPGGVEEYQEIACDLNDLCREERIELGGRMYEKAIKAGRDGYGYGLYQPKDKTPILFLSMSGPRHVRLERLRFLTAHAYVLLGVTRILGVATSSSVERTGGEEFALLEHVRFENETEMRTRAAKLFRRMPPIHRDQWGNESEPVLAG